MSPALGEARALHTGCLEDANRNTMLQNPKLDRDPSLAAFVAEDGSVFGTLEEATIDVSIKTYRAC
eukprot:3935212-Rhodomonas_salina.2